MQDFTKLNINKIIGLSSFLKDENDNYKFCKKQVTRFLWLFKTVKEEGFYKEITNGWDFEFVLIPKEEIEKDSRIYCEGERVYYKPHVRIKLEDGTVQREYFNSEKELFEFCGKYFGEELKWIHFKS